MPDAEQVIRIDAKTFQEALGKLAATMVQKVFREGHQHIAGPQYVREDIATLVRYGASVYNLLNYLNADERRNGDCYWYVRYGVTAMSLVRALRRRRSMRAGRRRSSMSRNSSGSSPSPRSKLMRVVPGTSTSDCFLPSRS